MTVSPVIQDLEKWLPGKESDLHKLVQSQLSYH